MASTRILDCIGASSTDIVRLSLLLQAAAHRLQDIWEWGPEEEAEVVLIDATNPKGAAALQRSRHRGVYFALLIDRDAPNPSSHYLRRPVDFEELISLLNDGMKRTVVPLALLDRNENFFEVDLDPVDTDDTPLMEFTPPSTAIDHDLDGFESLFRRDPLAHKPRFVIPGKLDDGIGVAPAEHTGSEARAEAHRNPFMPAGAPVAGKETMLRPDLKASFSDSKSHPLGSYLESALLGGPARIQLPDAPALVLDPKERLFHATGRLTALEPYFKQPLRMGDWERLTNVEMVELRRRIPAKPYLRLAWMDRYLHSNGYLASHLDPGGTYRLTRWLELAQDYPRAARVGRSMIAAQRLDEIARASDMSMAEIFDVVNAYEAIGYVDWTHRPRAQRA